MNKQRKLLFKKSDLDYLFRRPIAENFTRDPWTHPVVNVAITILIFFVDCRDICKFFSIFKKERINICILNNPFNNPFNRPLGR